MRRLLAEQHEVQLPGEEQADERAQDDRRADQANVLPAAVIESAHQPEQDLAVPLPILSERDDGGRDRATERAYGDPRQNQCGRCAPPPCGRDRVDGKSGRERARKGRERHGEEMSSAQPRCDGYDRCQRAATRHAQHAGIGKRVAEQALQHGTG